MKSFLKDSFILKVIRESFILNFIRKKPENPFNNVISNSAIAYYYNTFLSFFDSSIILNNINYLYKHLPNISIKYLFIILSIILMLINLYLIKYVGISLILFFIFLSVSFLFFVTFFFFEWPSIKNSFTIRLLQIIWNDFSSNLSAFFWAFFPFFDLLFRRFTPLKGLWDELFIIVFLFISFCLLVKNKIKLPTYSIYLFIFYFCVIISGLNSSVPYAVSIEGMRSIIVPTIIFFITYIHLKVDKKPEKVQFFISICCLFLGLIGVFQYVMGFNMPVGWVDIDYEALIIRTRAYSIIGSPNFLAGYLLFGIGSSLSMLLISKKFIKRTLWLSILILLTISLALTFTRGAFIALGISTAFMAVISGPLILLLLVFGGVASYYVAPSLVNRILYLFSPEYITKSLTAGGRLYRWLMALEHLKENLLLGSGPGTFGGGPAIKYGFFQGISVDNYFLKIFAETGLIGGISFLLLFLNLFRYGIYGYFNNKNNNLKYLSFGGLISIIAFFLHNGVENLWDAPGLVILFSMISALLVYIGEEI